MLRLRLRRAVFLCGILALVPALRAQVPEYQLKAEFLERFTRFIEWPAEALSGPAFVIGVVGRSPFGPFLDGLAAGWTIKDKPVKVVSFPDAAHLGDCHVLFIPAAERKELPGILARTDRQPVLTVSDTEGFAEKGVHINFYPAEDRVGFEINDAAVRRSGLKVSSRLLKLARVINLEADR